ncbi:hypothetical protein RB199_29355 [Streptomyces libani]
MQPDSVVRQLPGGTGHRLAQAPGELGREEPGGVEIVHLDLGEGVQGAGQSVGDGLALGIRPAGRRLLDEGRGEAVQLTVAEGRFLAGEGEQPGDPHRPVDRLGDRPVGGQEPADQRSDGMGREAGDDVRGIHGFPVTAVLNMGGWGPALLVSLCAGAGVAGEFDVGREGVAGLRAEVGEKDLLEFRQGRHGGEVDGAVDEAIELEIPDTGESREGRPQQAAHIGDRKALRVEDAEPCHLWKPKTGRQLQGDPFFRHTEREILQLAQ